MVDIVLKLTKPEETVTTASNISNSVLIRVYAPNAAVITIKDNLGTTKGSMSMPAGLVEIIEKLKTDTIEATAAVKVTAVAYK